MADRVLAWARKRVAASVPRDPAQVAIDLARRVAKQPDYPRIPLMHKTRTKIYVIEEHRARVWRRRKSAITRRALKPTYLGWYCVQILGIENNHTFLAIPFQGDRDLAAWLTVRYEERRVQTFPFHADEWAPPPAPPRSAW